MSREEAIAQLAKVFRQYGYDGATLTRLSKATGLGKASLYHYFPKGKEEMAAAVLDYLKYRFEEYILKPLREDGEPIDRIRVMSRQVNEFYNHGHNSCLLAVLAFGESNDLFHRQIQEAFDVWIDTLAKVLMEKGLDPDYARHKSEDAILKIQGALILARGLGDRAPFERVINRLPEELL